MSNHGKGGGATIISGGVPPVPGQRQSSHACAVQQLKEFIPGTIDHHASKRWPALEEVTIAWRRSYGYLTGFLSSM
ncbi:MAG TPA: hypothetical protein VIU11_10815 [Nakamurella sp.]